MRRARHTGQNHSSSYCRPRPVWQGTERRGCCQQERELKPHYRSTIVSPAFIFFSSKCFPPVFAYRLRFSNAGISCTRCINGTRVIGVALLRNRAGDSEKSSPRGLGAGLVPAAPPRGFVRNKTTSRNRHQARAPCDRADAETTVKKRRADRFTTLSKHKQVQGHCKLHDTERPVSRVRDSSRTNHSYSLASPHLLGGPY